MTIDDLLAAEVATADGRLLRVDAEHHPDLFWAIRGGGGNFGVATRLKFRLHEVDTIVGGMLFLPASPDVLAAFIAEAEAAPEELSTIANVMPAPPLPFLAPEHHGRLVVMAMLVYAGDLEAGERAIAPFRALATPVADMVRPMPYPEMYPPGDESYRPVAVTRTLFTDSVELRTAESILSWLERSTAPMAAAQLRVLGGAMARVPADATAFAHRDRRILANVVAMYAQPEERAEHAGLGRRPRERAEPGRPGRLRGLPRRRGRGARPRGLPGLDVGAAGGGEGRLRPGEPLPAEPERPAGRGVVRLVGVSSAPTTVMRCVGTDHPGSQPMQSVSRLAGSQTAVSPGASAPAQSAQVSARRNFNRREEGATSSRLGAHRRLREKRCRGVVLTSRSPPNGPQAHEPRARRIAACTASGSVGAGSNCSHSANASRSASRGAISA